MNVEHRRDCEHRGGDECTVRDDDPSLDAQTFKVLERMTHG